MTCCTYYEIVCVVTILLLSVFSVGNKNKSIVRHHVCVYDNNNHETPVFIYELTWCKKRN